jgi:MFS family permease
MPRHPARRPVVRQYCLSQQRQQQRQRACWQQPRRSSTSSRNGFSVLRHRNFAFYLSARTLGTLAVQMQNVAIGWQVYAMTHNLFDLGLIGLAQFALPALILLAGHAADRYDRRNLIALALARSCCAACCYWHSRWPA